MYVLCSRRQFLYSEGKLGPARVMRPTGLRWGVASLCRGQKTTLPVEDNWQSGLLSSTKQRLSGARLLVGRKWLTLRQSGERLPESRCFVEDKRPLCQLSSKRLEDNWQSGLLSSTFSACF